MPPASKANSRSAKPGSAAKPVRSRWTYSCAEWSPLVRELHLDDGVHRPGVGRVGGRQVGDHAELGDDQSAGPRPSCSRTNCSTSRDPLLGLLDPRAARGADVDLEGAGVDLREELAAEPRAQQPDDRGQRQHGAEDDRDSMTHRPVELPRVPADAGLDQPFPAGERAGNKGTPRGASAHAFLRSEGSARAWSMWTCGRSHWADRAGTNVRDSR